MSARREETRRDRHSQRSSDYIDYRSSKPSSSTCCPDRRSRSRERTKNGHHKSLSTVFSSQKHGRKQSISPSKEHSSSKRSRQETHNTYSYRTKSESKPKKPISNQKNAENLPIPDNNIASPTTLPEVTRCGPGTANLCPSGDLPLDLEALDRKSEQRLRQEKVVHLPDSNTFYFEKQKEQYYTNMYRLIVTARSQIQQLEQQVELLNKRLDCKSIVTCPDCQHNFSTGPNRYLPKYLKVLRSTNRVELQFNDGEHLKNWMVGADLDRDAKGIPCLINEKERIKDAHSNRWKVRC